MLNTPSKRYFRDQFRSARYKALKDAEDFESLFHALEALGSFLTNDPDAIGLGNYKGDIRELLADSPFRNEIPKEFPAYHNNFDHLYEYVRLTRNDAAHEGVYARNKTRYAIELGLIIEEQLNKMDENITNYMVRNPQTAQLWEPLSHIRKEMLVNSYSYIPIYFENVWKLISDYHLNNFLSNYGGDKREGLRLNVKFGIQKDLELEKPDYVVDEEFDISGLELSNSKPVLVTDKKDESRLLGLLTGFDLL